MLSDSNLSFRNILLVEDNSLDMGILKRCLSRIDSSFALSEARCGKEALKKARSRDFDFVLLDHNLPGITGLECLEQIKALKKHQPAVIVVTGIEDQKLLQSFISSGAQEILSKSTLTTETLRIALNRARTRLDTNDNSLEGQSISLRNLNEAYLLVDSDLRVVEANRKAQEILEEEGKNLLGRGIEDMLLLDSFEPGVSLREFCLSTELEKSMIEVVCFGVDGERRKLKCSLSNLLISGQNYCLWIIREISSLNSDPHGDRILEDLREIHEDQSIEKLQSIQSISTLLRETEIMQDASMLEASCYLDALGNEVEGFIQDFENFRKLRQLFTRSPQLTQIWVHHFVEEVCGRKRLQLLREDIDNKVHENLEVISDPVLLKEILSLLFHHCGKIREESSSIEIRCFQQKMNSGSNWFRTGILVRPTRNIANPASLYSQSPSNSNSRYNIMDLSDLALVSRLLKKLSGSLQARPNSQGDILFVLDLPLSSS